MRPNHVLATALLFACGCTSDALPDEPVTEPVPFAEAESQPQARHAAGERSGNVLVSYEVVATTCPHANTGWWMDGRYGWVHVVGSEFSISFSGFPDMTGTLDATGAGSLVGQTQFMVGAGLVTCDIAGKAVVASNRMTGTVTERLSGGQSCETVGRFSFSLPE